MFYGGWVPLESMGKTWSAYIKDDDLNDAVEKAIDSGEYHNQAHFFTEAVKAELDWEEDRDDPIV